MEVVRGLERVEFEGQSSVTIGSFDGLHLGHQRILRRMRSSGFRPVTLVTFDPHPQTIVRPDDGPPPQLTTFQERLELFQRHGVARLIIIHFDEQFAKMTAEDFVREVLSETIGAGLVFVGARHGFGAGRRGNAELLRQMGEKLGFGLEIVHPVVRDRGSISSSRIRKLLGSGEALTAMRYLGRPFYLIGNVIAGDGRGHGLGVPTANILFEDAAKLKPPEGIYVSVTEVEGMRYPSVTHIGERPTFPGAAATVETHLIGFHDDLYGKTIRIGLVDRLRGVEHFSTAEALIVKLKKDIYDARKRLIAIGFSHDAVRHNLRLGKTSDNIKHFNSAS